LKDFENVADRIGDTVPLAILNGRKHMNGFVIHHLKPFTNS